MSEPRKKRSSGGWRTEAYAVERAVGAATERGEACLAHCLSGMLGLQAAGLIVIQPLGQGTDLRECIKGLDTPL